MTPPDPIIASAGQELRLRDWLQRPHACQSDEFFLTGLAEQLAAAGFQIPRITLALSDAHPEVWGRYLVWRAGRDLTVLNDSYERHRNDEYWRSPMAAIHEGLAAIRRPLHRADCQMDFPLLHDLKQDGFTDYAAFALNFSDGSRQFISIASDQPTGFSADELSALDALMPLIALRVELIHARRLHSTLLRTYLGARAASQIERGEIRRAQGSRIQAIIAFADLRSFTHMANNLPSDDIVRVLSHYYEAVAEPLEARGGEINKLIGDGMLALFPLENLDPIYTNQLASSIVQGATESHARLAAISPALLPRGIDRLRAGIVLHVGEVTFGNVGSKTRLDYTVIGPAVNEAARMQPLTKSLSRPLLLSHAFTQLPCSIKFESVGHHELYGFPGLKEIFALPGF